MLSNSCCSLEKAANMSVQLYRSDLCFFPKRCNCFITCFWTICFKYATTIKSKRSVFRRDAAIFNYAPRISSFRGFNQYIRCRPINLARQINWPPRKIEKLLGLQRESDFEFFPGIVLCVSFSRNLFFKKVKEKKKYI